MKAYTSSELYPTTFDCLFFFIYHERYGFVWAFFIDRPFLPYAPSRHFWCNLLLSRPPWELAVLPWSLKGFMLILEMQTQPICIYTCQYCKSFTCGENFDKKILFFWFSVLDKIRLSSRSATTLISQQPWKHKAAATLISNHKLQNNCSLKKYISEHKCKNYVNLCEFMWIYG